MVFRWILVEKESTPHQCTETPHVMCITPEALPSWYVVKEVTNHPRGASNCNRPSTLCHFRFIYIVESEDVLSDKQNVCRTLNFNLSLIWHCLATSSVTRNGAGRYTRDDWQIITSHTFVYYTESRNSLENMIFDLVNKVLAYVSLYIHRPWASEATQGQEEDIHQ